MKSWWLVTHWTYNSTFSLQWSGSVGLVSATSASLRLYCNWFVYCLWFGRRTERWRSAVCGTLHNSHCCHPCHSGFDRKQCTISMDAPVCGRGLPHWPLAWSSCRHLGLRGAGLRVAYGLGYTGRPGQSGATPRPTPIRCRNWSKLTTPPGAHWWFAACICLHRAATADADEINNILNLTGRVPLPLFWCTLSTSRILDVIILIGFIWTKASFNKLLSLYQSVYVNFVHWTLLGLLESLLITFLSL